MEFHYPPYFKSLQCASDSTTAIPKSCFVSIFWFDFRLYGQIWSIVFHVLLISMEYPEWGQWTRRAWSMIEAVGSYKTSQDWRCKVWQLLFNFLNEVDFKHTEVQFHITTLCSNDASRKLWFVLVRNKHFMLSPLKYNPREVGCMHIIIVYGLYQLSKLLNY